MVTEEVKEPHILVVDDDSTLLKFFKIHLNKYFSKVIVVDSPVKAIEIIKDQEIDLVISDYKMPKSNGVQLAKKNQKYRRKYSSIHDKRSSYLRGGK